VYFYYDFKWHCVNYVYRNVFICSDEDIDPVPAALTNEPKSKNNNYSAQPTLSISSCRSDIIGLTPLEANNEKI
jgi:hypothetical protein